MKKWSYTLGCIMLAVGLTSCSAKSSKSATPVAYEQATVEDNVVEDVATVPEFNADSAYAYVERQVAFGYRIPNTPAHLATAAYLADELSRHGATVTVQEGEVIAYDGTRLSIRNIFGAFSPEKQNRILLFAHWDTRPYADNDPDESKHRTPIAGADDGASGVGVLLEIARQIGAQQPGVGVDIAFFDAEDYGEPYWATSAGDDDSWALGSQYWAARPHKSGYRARCGILLDMVGGKDAQFRRELFSNYYAAPLVDQVWKTAKRLGYGNYFVERDGGYINDDHLAVNQYGIPSIDIIPCNPATATGFPPYWHTLDDTMENIDRATLKAVGQTVLTVIYED